MRTTLRRIGLVSGILVAALSIGSGVATAAPGAASSGTTAVNPTEVRASAEVYIDTYPHAECFAGILYYNSRGYMATCKVVSTTHSALYVLV